MKILGIEINQTSISKAVAGVGLFALVGIGVYSNVELNSQAKQEAALDSAASEVLASAQKYHKGFGRGKTAEDAATEFNADSKAIKAQVETSGQFVTVLVSGYGTSDLKSDAIIGEGGAIVDSSGSRRAAATAERNKRLADSKSSSDEKSTSLIEKNAPENRAAEIEDSLGN